MTDFLECLIVTIYEQLLYLHLFRFGISFTWNCSEEATDYSSWTCEFKIVTSLWSCSKTKLFVSESISFCVSAASRIFLCPGEIEN